MATTLWDLLQVANDIYDDEKKATRLVEKILARHKVRLAPEERRPIVVAATAA